MSISVSEVVIPMLVAKRKTKGRILAYVHLKVFDMIPMSKEEGCLFHIHLKVFKDFPLLAARTKEKVRGKEPA